jgi:hypothetical protein
MSLLNTLDRPPSCSPDVYCPQGRLMKRPGWIVRYKGEKRWRNVLMMLVADLFIVSMGIQVFAASPRCDTTV